MKSLYSTAFMLTIATLLDSTNQKSTLEHIVQAGHEQIPKVLSSAKHYVKNIPISKREARERAMIDPLTGEPYIVTLPADLWRNYDEAVINIY